MMLTRRWYAAPPIAELTDAYNYLPTAPDWASSSLCHRSLTEALANRQAYYILSGKYNWLEDLLQSHAWRTAVHRRSCFIWSLPDTMTDSADTEYATCKQTCHSATDYTFLLIGGPVSWNEREQLSLIISPAEAEEMTVASAVQQYRS